MPSSLRSDASLAKKAARDPEQFRVLYHRYAENIYRFVRYRVNSEHDAQDIVSDVFYKALKRIHQYSPEYAFSTWIYTIARNTIIDYWRTQKVTVDLEKIEHMLADERNISDAVDVSIDVEHIMSQLTETERTLVTLRFEQDLSFADIAHITGRSEGALRTAFHRLRKKIESYA